LTSNNTAVDEEHFIWYSASIRISGETLDFNQIADTLKLEPEHTHRKGEINPFELAYDSDMWLYTAAVPKTEPLDIHLITLWSSLKPHKEFLIELKKNSKIDLFCGYRSNSTTAGFGLSPAALEIVNELQIKLEVSVFFI